MNYSMSWLLAFVGLVGSVAIPPECTTVSTSPILNALLDLLSALTDANQLVD